MNHVDELEFYNSISAALIAKESIASLIEQFQLPPAILEQRINFYPEDKSHLLNLACYHDHLENVQTLINLKTNLNVLSQSPDGMNFKETGLITASKIGSIQTVSLLLENNANVTIQDNYGRTALIWAKNKKHQEITQLLQTAHNTILESRQRPSPSLFSNTSTNPLPPGISTLFSSFHKILFPLFLAIAGLTLMLSGLILACTTLISPTVTLAMGGVGLFAVQRGYQNIASTFDFNINLRV